MRIKGTPRNAFEEWAWKVYGVAWKVVLAAVLAHATWVFIETGTLNAWKMIWVHDEVVEESDRRMRVPND